jgi:hypothetical protein
MVHFEFRHLWYGGIKTIDEVEHFLPGIGSRHRHVLENGRIEMMYISSFLYNPEGKTIFSETNQKDKSTIYFIAEKTANIPAGSHSRYTLSRTSLSRLSSPSLKKRKKSRNSGYPSNVLTRS